MNPKHVTSKKLSDQLKGAGIPQESGFIWVNDRGWKLREKTYLHIMPKNIDWVSAFHVGELGEMLKITRWTETKLQITGQHKINVLLNGEQEFIADTEAEARGKMLLYLKKEGLI